VQRSASFIVAELGSSAACLAPDAVPLLRSIDNWVRYYALDIVTIAAAAGHAALFAHVALQLDADDQRLRVRAMSLLTNATSAMIHGALQCVCAQHRDPRHEQGLSLLEASYEDALEPAERYISGVDALLRRYAAVAAVRREIRQALLLLNVSDDRDLELYATEHGLGAHPPQSPVP
jgi:hypothetical protein